MSIFIYLYHPKMAWERWYAKQRGKEKFSWHPSASQDRFGRADAVWYERTEGQFSPRHSDRPVSRLASNSPFGLSREPSEPPPRNATTSQPGAERRSTDATLQRAGMEPDRVRRSFPRRTSTGTDTRLDDYRGFLYGDGSKTYYYHIWKNQHPLTSYFRYHPGARVLTHNHMFLLFF